jgi:hypothetical protein
MSLAAEPTGFTDDGLPRASAPELSVDSLQRRAGSVTAAIGGQR